MDSSSIKTDRLLISNCRSRDDQAVTLVVYQYQLTPKLYCASLSTEPCYYSTAYPVILL